MQHVVAAGDDFPGGAVGVDVGAVLVDVGDPHRLADPDHAPVGRLAAGEHLEQSGLADPVGTDDADDSVARQRERQIGEQFAITERLAQAFGLDDQIAQPRPRRNVDLVEVEAAGLRRGRRHFFVTAQPRAAFGLPGHRRRTHPFQFALQLAQSLGVLAALHL
jgi:hypothetical protein